MRQLRLSYTLIFKLLYQMGGFGSFYEKSSLRAVFVSALCDERTERVLKFSGPKMEHL